MRPAPGSLVSTSRRGRSQLCGEALDGELRVLVNRAVAVRAQACEVFRARYCGCCPSRERYAVMRFTIRAPVSEFRAEATDFATEQRIFAAPDLLDRLDEASLSLDPQMRNESPLAF